MSKSVVLLLVLVFLTTSSLVAFKSVSSVDVVENSWVSKASMQVARSGLGVAVVKGKIYAIGGSTRSGGGGTKSGPLPSTGGVVGTNEEYDPETDNWTFKASMPTPRTGFATAVYQNKIYCIGGGVNEVYDPETDTWENKTAMPSHVSALEASVVGGKIYLIGGFIADDSGISGSRVTLNQVYDPETDYWTTAAPMPTAALDYASAVVDNKIYFTDGFSKNPPSLLNQIYDPATDSWSQVTPPPSSTQHGAAGATTGVNALKRIYVLGETWNLWEDEPTYTVRVYNPANDRWTIGANIPTDRLDFGVAVVNDRLYVVGGYTTTYPDGIYSYPYGPSLTPHATNEQYTPFGYGTVPPVVLVISSENQTYSEADVPLVFSVNRPVSWIGYSVDGLDNVTVSGNVTMTGLSNGLHNVTVYTEDSFGNVGASETISFSVEVPFPTALVAVASGASATIIAIGLLVYFKKRPH